MEQLSDKDLLLLSNLMHIKKDKERDNGKFFKDVWTEGNAKKGVTIGEIVEGINEKLATFTETERQEFLTTVFDGEIEGSEWEQMLQKISNNPALSSLILQKVDVDDKKALAICLTDSSGQAYVVFRGTGAGEWPDNSKGGNKAKYVAILSDKILRCVSFDG